MPAQAYGAPPFDPSRMDPDPRLEPAPAVTPPERGPSVRLRNRDVDVQVSVSASDARVAARMRALLTRSNVDLAACRARLDSPLTRAEERSVSFGAVRPGALRDVVGQCLFNALAPLYARSISSAQVGAPVSVRCVFSPRVRVESPPERRPPPNLCPNPRPQGCRRTGCPAGLVCDTRVQCVPSACSCDPQTGRVICTDDCGGGVCVVPGTRPGDQPPL